MDIHCEFQKLLSGNNDRFIMIRAIIRIMALSKYTIDEIFKEAYAQIEMDPKAESLGSIRKDGVTLYSYQPFKEKKRKELFEIITHFNPKNIEEKLQHFVNKDKIIIKNREIYYPTLEILLDKEISPKEFYEKTKSFLKNSKYELNWFNPIDLIVKGLCEMARIQRKKYRYETEFFFCSQKEDSDVMGSVYNKNSDRYLSLTSESPQEVKKYAKKSINALI